MAKLPGRRSPKKVVIVGGGSGGLATAMILAAKGLDVTLFEARSGLGGRSAMLALGPYRFDTGPTRLAMHEVIADTFALAGKRLEDFCVLRSLDPLYRISLPDTTFELTTDRDAMGRTIDSVFPGSSEGLARFYKREGRRYRGILPGLNAPFASPMALLRPRMLRALPHVSLSKSVHDILGGYFDDERLRAAFSVQPRYLGMSPGDCPGLFTMLSYAELGIGARHVEGGVGNLVNAMVRATRDERGKVYCEMPVRRILVDRGRACGVELYNGEKVDADAVVVNADFGYAVANLFEPGTLAAWTPDTLAGRGFSCSAFMLYLGLDTIYKSERHETVLLPADYHEFAAETMARNRLPDDISVHLSNPSVIDPSFAPAGHSAITALVFVPNNRSGLPWDDSMTEAMRDKVLGMIESRTTMSGLRNHIVKEQTITPLTWEEVYRVHLGATFSLSHTMDQLLSFRPHNRFEGCRGCYLVGAGTHPGSGLAAVHLSAQISSRLILHDLGVAL